PRYRASAYASVRADLVPAIFFFFQAEDGIRDFHVTGVQTCALPISGPAPETGSALPEDCRTRCDGAAHQASVPSVAPPWDSTRRSEERRVGKESSDLCPPYRCKRKNGRMGVAGVRSWPL